MSDVREIETMLLLLGTSESADRRFLAAAPDLVADLLGEIEGFDAVLLEAREEAKELERNRSDAEYALKGFALEGFAPGENILDYLVRIGSVVRGIETLFSYVREGIKERQNQELLVWARARQAELEDVGMRKSLAELRPILASHGGSHTHLTTKAKIAAFIARNQVEREGYGRAQALGYASIGALLYAENRKANGPFC